jgi:hypothetical protein
LEACPFVYIFKPKLLTYPVQVSTPRPVQYVPPITMFDDRIYVNGELWQYWREAFPQRSVRDMFDFVKCEIDDEHAVFTRSLAW